MHSLLDICFGEKTTLTFDEFQKITEEIASDMLLSIINIFREKLPCSENFWRYKRNYELHMESQEPASDQVKDGQEEKKLEQPSSPGLKKKLLASPQL